MYYSQSLSVGGSPVKYSNLTLPVISVKQAILDDIGHTNETNKSLLAAVMTKNKNPWGEENEFRLIGKIPEGCVKFDIEAVKSVYIGEKMEEKRRDSLCNILSKYYGCVQIHEVSINVEQKDYIF